MTHWREAFHVTTENPLEWAMRHITIPAETQTPWPGRYRIENTPWVKGWFDVMADKNTRMFACKKGAQIAWTHTTQMVMFFRSCEMPGNALWVADSLDGARKMSQIRMQPIINASSRLLSEFAELGEDTRETLQNVFYRFKRCSVRMVGANSAGQAASLTYRDIYLEEPNKYPLTIGDEGNVIDLFIERQKRIWNRLCLIGCTPTTPDGAIEKYVQIGDRMMYFVPCPKCGTFQVLAFNEVYALAGQEDRTDADKHIPFARVVFDAELSPTEAGRSAYIACANPDCKHHINERDKRAMVDRGEWRPTKEPEMTGYRSCEIGGLYPKDDSASISNAVETFLTKRHKKADLQVWVNSHLGQTWYDKPKTRAETSTITQIRDFHQFPPMTIPTKRPVVLVVCIDVQDAYLPYSIWAMRKGDLYMIQHGNASTFDDIETIIGTPIARHKKPNKTQKIAAAVLDTGHRTKECYDWTLRVGQDILVIPIKGERGQITSMAQPIRHQRIGQYPGGEPLPWEESIILRHIHPIEWHREMYNCLAKLDPKDGQTAKEAWEDRPLRVHFHQNVDTRYARSVTADVIVESDADKYGRTRERVQTLRKDNHQGDLFRYALVAYEMLKEDLYALDEPAPAQAQVNPSVPVEGMIIDDNAVRL